MHSLPARLSALLLACAPAAARHAPDRLTGELFAPGTGRAAEGP